MTSSPTSPWKIGRKTMETVKDFIFLDSKITVDGDYSHEIKRRLLLRRKDKETVLKAAKTEIKTVSMNG